MLRSFARLDRSERRTLVMGMLALTTVGAVAAGELGRLWRRRVVVEEPEGAPEVIQKGARAALDTVEVARRGYIEGKAGETALFNLLSAFVISSSVIRLTTFGVRKGVPLFFNVRVGRRHIHHFIPGILLAFGSGAAAIFTDSARTRETLAIPLGIGIGLTVDESALLLDLEDVYWSREGLVGVQITLATASLLAAGVIALRIIRRGEHVLEEQHELPRVPETG
ncbi:MAG: hypothetical protein WBD55_04175 [Dehalococcoidia bacterium]